MGKRDDAWVVADSLLSPLTLYGAQDPPPPVLRARECVEKFRHNPNLTAQAIIDFAEGLLAAYSIGVRSQQ